MIRLEDGELTVGGEARAFDDPYAAVAEELARYRVAPLEGLPPFAGGAVGLFGYDLVRYAEPTVGRAEPRRGRHARHGADGVATCCVAFDHLRHEVTILANVFVEDDVERRLRARRPRAIADVRERLAGRRCRARAPGAASRPAFESQHRLASGYADGGRARARSTSAPATPTRWCRASAGAPTRPVEAFSIYRGLRAVNPSPYMYFLDFEDFEIAGASPESLVKVDGPPRRAAPDRRHAAARRHRRGGPRARGGAAGRREGARRARDARRPRPQRPRPRVRVRQRDGRRADGRRDLLARAAHRLVGVGHAARGRHRDGRAAGLASRRARCRARPKIRAMQIIDELEPVKRGPYGGAVGYLSYTGDLDTCIYIRSALVKDGRVHVQAGGGIVADSEAGYEVRETEAKAGAVFGAIELACAQGDWA